MKKTTTLLMLLLAVCFYACKKSDKATPSNNNTNNDTTGQYYFKFTLNGQNYDYNYNFPQYLSLYPFEAGGYQVAAGGLFPSIGLSLDWPASDTVTESQLMSLAGKTLYFNDTFPQPGIDVDSTVAGAPSWLAVDTASTNYNVKINSITFLKKDTILNSIPVRVYVINGTVTALLQKGSVYATLTAGQFNFIMSRQDH